MQRDVAWSTKLALVNQTVVHNKLWIGLFVEKPDHRGDAINVVDLVCDGIRDAIDVDDRWFCLQFVDWRVNKADPKIFIQIGQEDVEPSQVCSYCGQILVLESFTKKTGNPHGHDRVCRECRKQGRILAKQKISK